MTAGPARAHEAYTEGAFEDAIEAALLQGKWEKGLANTYNHELGIDTSELSTFLDASQGDDWERLMGIYGEEEEQAIQRFAAHVAKQIDTRGLLDVLRHGVIDRNVKLRLAFVRPAHTLAAGALDEYEANRLTFVRQFNYAANGPAKPLDRVLFLNGLPIASVELKNPLTGSTAQDAIRQYRTDRDPKELFFARRSLVHFAVDPDLVFLTTRLAGAKTRFLPFNKGTGGPGEITERATRSLRTTPSTAPRTCGKRSGSATTGSTSFTAISTSRTKQRRLASTQTPPRCRTHPALDLPAVPPVGCCTGADGARRQVRRRRELPCPALSRLG